MGNTLLVYGIIVELFQSLVFKKYIINVKVSSELVHIFDQTMTNCYMFCMLYKTVAGWQFVLFLKVFLSSL